MATQKEKETHRIRPIEVLMFILLGLVPIGALYFFATQGIQDEAGRLFEVHRRAMISACMNTLEDRDECRTQVDVVIIECYADHKTQAGEIKDDAAFRACASRNPTGEFRARTEKEKAADAELVKSRRR